MTFLIQQTLLYAVPLMIVALAGVFAERSGIINLALEGIMSLQAGEASSLMREKLLAFVDDEERKLMEEEENRL